MLSHNYYFIFLYLIHSSLYVYIYRIDVIHSLTSVPTVLTFILKKNDFLFKMRRYKEE